MINDVYIDLDGLRLKLNTAENGAPVRYTMTLAKDRQSVQLERERYAVGDEEMKFENALEYWGKEYTLDELRTDQSHPALVTWLARGMWGIPAELGKNAYDRTGQVIDYGEIESRDAKELLAVVRGENDLHPASAGMGEAPL